MTEKPTDKEDFEAWKDKLNKEVNPFVPGMSGPDEATPTEGTPALNPAPEPLATVEPAPAPESVELPSISAGENSAREPTYEENLAKGKRRAFRQGTREFTSPLGTLGKYLLIAGVAAALGYYAHDTKRRVDKTDKRVESAVDRKIRQKVEYDSQYVPKIQEVGREVGAVENDVKAIKEDVKVASNNYNLLRESFGKLETGINEKLGDLDSFIHKIYDGQRKSDSTLESLMVYAGKLGKRTSDIEKEQKDILAQDISKGLEGTIKPEDLYKFAEPSVVGSPVDGPKQKDAIEDWAYARHFNNNVYTDAQIKENPITTLLNKPIRPDLKGYGAEPLGFVADGVQLSFEGIAYGAGKVPFIGNILEKPFKWGGRLTSGVVRAVPFFGPDSTYLATHPYDAMTKNTGPSIETIIDDIALGLVIYGATRHRDHDHGGSSGSSSGGGVNVPGGPVDW